MSNIVKLKVDTPSVLLDEISQDKTVVAFAIVTFHKDADGGTFHSFGCMTSDLAYASIVMQKHALETLESE